MRAQAALSFTSKLRWCRSFYPVVLGACGRSKLQHICHPAELRKDPKFVKLVEAFVKKHPEGFYAQQAQALLPAK